MNIKSLHHKIISSFEQKQANLRGLKGLKVKELKRVIKKNEHILSQSMHSEMKEERFTGQMSKDTMLDSKMHDGKVEIPRDEGERTAFWQMQCQAVPEHGKVGEYIHEHEQLLFEIDSQDIWIRVKLQMVEQRNVIEAEMDLKVEKQMVRSEFNNLIQKLTLKMWNDCS